MDRTIMNEIKKKEIREQNIVEQDDAEAAKDLNVQHQKETEEGNKKINALQKQHDSALDEFDNNSLQVETQKEFNKHINPNPPKPNLMGITEARNENES